MRYVEAGFQPAGVNEILCIDETTLMGLRRTRQQQVWGYLSRLRPIIPPADTIPAVEDLPETPVDYR